MTLMIFPLIMAIDMFWNKFALALLFPLAMMVLVPISLSSSRPDGPHEPKVSCAMGIKWNLWFPFPCNESIYLFTTGRVSILYSPQNGEAFKVGSRQRFKSCS